MNKYYVEHRNDGYSKEELIRYVVSFVLGDGSLLDNNKVPSYRVQQRTKNRDYIEWQSNILANITRVCVTEIPAHKSTTRTYSDALYLRTMSHPLFGIVKERMYRDRIKTISYHDANLLNLESLAILIMDDGYFYKTRERYSIATMSFSEAENKMLRDVFAHKYGIHFNIRKVSLRSGIKYFLQANTKQSRLLAEKIRPYMLPSFYYKLPQTVTE